MKYYSKTIVFQEVPNEVSLAFSITGCKNNCINCHSAFLREDIGELLTQEVLEKSLEEYGEDITTILFLGGEHRQDEIKEYCCYLKDLNYKTAWYCGYDDINRVDQDLLKSLDYFKIGSYKEEYGGLKCKNTNQKFFKKVNSEFVDITYKFWT